MTLFNQPALCRHHWQQVSLGSLGLHLTRVSCGSISKSFLCCCYGICKPCVLLLSWIRPLSDLTWLLPPIQGTPHVFIFCNLCLIRSLQTLSQLHHPSPSIDIQKQKKSVIGNFNTSKDPLGSSEGVRKEMS